MNYNRDPRRLFWYGLTVMFILIGIAAILSVIFNSSVVIRSSVAMLESTSEPSYLIPVATNDVILAFLLNKLIYPPTYF